MVGLEQWTETKNSFAGQYRGAAQGRIPASGMGFLPGHLRLHYYGAEAIEAIVNKLPL